MKILKGKFWSLLITLIFVVSNFSGLCALAMDMDNSMAMKNLEIAHEETTASAEIHNPQMNCGAACEVGLCEVSEKKISPNQTIVLSNTDIQPYQTDRFITKNIFTKQWSPPERMVVHALVGSYQEGIKLVI